MMKKNLLSFLCVLLFTGFAFAQPKPKPTTVAKKPKFELEKILTGIGLPYQMISDSMAVIPYEGENIASYQVIVQKISDLYIIYTNLSEAIPDKLTPVQYKYLLQRNDEFDLIKIGLADDETFYLRADLYKAIATTPIIKRIISQVANTTNIIAGALK